MNRHEPELVWNIVQTRELGQLTQKSDLWGVAGRPITSKDDIISQSIGSSKTNTTSSRPEPVPENASRESRSGVPGRGSQ